MSLAWTTVALVTLLLPGLLFFVGLTFPEQFTRENARKNALGQLAGAVLVSFFLHGAAFLLTSHVASATGWTWTGVRLDYVLAAFQLEGTDAVISPLSLARNLSTFSPQILGYFALLCTAGWILGAAMGEGVVRGRFRFLARHGWVYAMRPGVSVAYVLTHKYHGDRHLMYEGVLKDFGLKDDGTFSYVILEKVGRSYLLLSQEGTRTASESVSPIAGPGDGSQFLAIEGEDVANVVIVPGLRQMGINDADRLRLRRALQRDIEEGKGALERDEEEEETLPRVRYRWWWSFWAWTILAIAIGIAWTVAVHWLRPDTATIVAIIVSSLAWTIAWVLTPSWRS